MRKFEVCNQVRLKPACSATETSLILEILAIASIGIMLHLSRQRIAKALFRLCRLICTFVVCIWDKQVFS